MQSQVQDCRAALPCKFLQYSCAAFGVFFILNIVTNIEHIQDAAVTSLFKIIFIPGKTNSETLHFAEGNIGKCVTNIFYGIHIKIIIFTNHVI